MTPAARRLRSVLAAALLIAAVGPARAAGPPTQYDADLLRLSEILGALTYLDSLCGAPEAGVWRRQMDALIAAQRMESDDRRRYVDVFNRGHRTFASVHRTCTEQTRFVIDTYFREGARITGRLDERFGRGPDAAGLPGN
ncbi:MAG TPA: TIGR02301 family protein [Methylomirabilota bacterium]|nr:TIGR02301 family protein [Methylomirabilota bacterium]